MIVRSVAEILEDVAASRERRFADPIGPFAAHLGESVGAAAHVLGHEVTADAGIGASALGNDGRPVVRTTGTEIGRALRDLVDFRERALRMTHAGKPRLE